MLTQYDKAIAGLLTAIAVAVLHQYLSLNVSAETQAALDSLFVVLVMMLVPNKPKDVK